jgi:hypothetical protein
MTASSKKMEPKSKASGNKKRLLEDVTPENYFVLSDGRPLKNLIELSDALEEMNDDVYGHHVTEDKNDFARWVHDVFGDEELSLHLGATKSKSKQQLIILRYLVRRLR